MSNSDDHIDVDINEHIAELTIRLDRDDTQSPALMHELADLHRERARELSDRDLTIKRSDDRCYIPLEARWDESVFGSTIDQQGLSTANNSNINEEAYSSSKPVSWWPAEILPLSFNNPFSMRIYSGHCAAEQLQITDNLPAGALEALEESRTLYEVVAEIYPDYDRVSEVLLSLGQIEMLMGEPIHAIGSLVSLIEMFPDSKLVPHAQLAIADYFFIQQMFGAATDLYMQALQSQDAVLSTYAEFMLGWIHLDLPSYGEESPFVRLLNRELAPELNEAVVHRGVVAGLAFTFAIENRSDENKSPEDSVRLIESVTDRRSHVYEFVRVLSVFCRTSTTKLFNCPEGVASIRHQLALLKTNDGEILMARQLANELCADGYNASCELLRSIEEEN